MRYFCRFIAFVILLLSSIVVKSAINSSQFDIRHIGYSEGLSSQRVFSIVEDKYRTIWISTKEGINRYNGHTIKTYTLFGALTYGDMAGRTLRLLYSSKFGLWAYDNTGRVYRYSEEEDKFKLYLFLGRYIRHDCVLNKFHIDGDGSFWFGTNYGLFKKVCRKSLTCVISHQNVNDIVEITKTIYAGTSSGVYKVTNVRTSLLVKGVNIQTLFYDSASEHLWLGTFNNGLLVLNVHTQHMQFVLGQDMAFLNPIRVITNYNKDIVLIGIDGGGVYAVDKKHYIVNRFMNAVDITDPHLLGNGIYAVTKDSQGNIWIGSYTGGVSVMLKCDYPIKIFAHERGNVNSLKNNNVNKIEQNKNGDLWFANDLGISILKSSGLWMHILNNIVVVPLCKGSNGCLWAGTYGKGVYLLDENGRILRHLSKENGLLTTNYILALRQDKDGDLWIGGLDGSLQMIKKGLQESKSYNIKWIQSIEIVDKDRVAISTVSGFYVIDKRSGKIAHYLSLGEIKGKNASVYIDAMLFNGDGTVWLGTEGGGLNLYNMKTHQLKTFTIHDGLPSNDIYSLQYDSRHRLWISTGKGLAMVVNNHISNLNYLGDVDKEYNKSSFAQLDNGVFAFGSSNGAVLLSSDIDINTRYNAPLRFTGVTVDYADAEEESCLRPEIYRMLVNGKLSLDYNHNSFKVFFEAINYRFQRDIVYQYMLEGYDQHWSEVSSNGYASYSHVASGSYIFKVKCLRRSDGKILSVKKLQIDISQPWWNSFGAWMAYVILATLIFYFMMRYKSNKLQKKYDEDKIRFFTQTAHDIRTPVTLIMAPLEDLEREKSLSVDAHKLLSLARHNTQKLYTIITQLLDFEKFDISRSLVLCEPICLNNILAGEVANFTMLCDKKGIQLHLQMPEEKAYISAERHLLEMALDNILSNACKYTHTDGDIWVCLKMNQRKAKIEIKDNGIGISKEAQKHIFKEVYRAKNAIQTQESGTGFGLLQVRRIVKTLKGKLDMCSQENIGTTFSVVFDRISFQVNGDVEQTNELVINKPSYNKDVPNGNLRDEDKNTLLIVEDNDDLRAYLYSMFVADFNVIAKSNGQEALSFLSEQYPDLILSDVMMPGIQGDELCRKVKDNPETSGIPFILLTAKVSHDAVVSGLKQGADDYIPKPFNTEILKLKVQGMISNRNRLRDYLMRQVLNKVDDVIPANQHPDTTMSDDDHEFVLHATQIVIDNMADVDFSINLLCQEMAMSRTLFYSRLKSLTGKGPQEFIRIIRLQKAAKLLQEGKSVNEVSVNTGFVNTKYFSSLFKKYFGVQPSKYI